MTDAVKQESPLTMRFANDSLICSEGRWLRFRRFRAMDSVDKR